MAAGDWTNGVKIRRWTDNWEEVLLGISDGGNGA
jgi:hypothetical protein